AGDEAAKAGVCRSVRIALHGAELREIGSQRQGRRLADRVWRCARDIEKQPAIDPRLAVRLPELQRIVVGERDGAEVVGHAHELGLEDIRGGLVEAPVRQRDARVDRLKLALKIEYVGAM